MLNNPSFQPTAKKLRGGDIPLQTLAGAIPITIEATAEAALEEVRVNMAELKAENKPIELVTSVGSCVAICMHDSMNMCGGLAHIMLPASAKSLHEPLPAKFADTAIPALIRAIRRIGGATTHVSAKIAGGANMFPNMDAFRIGQKNVDSVRAALKEHGIPIVAEDVGGSSGRRITFNVKTGFTRVKRFGGDVTEL